MKADVKLVVQEPQIALTVATQFGKNATLQMTVSEAETLVGLLNEEITRARSVMVTS